MFVLGCMPPYAYAHTRCIQVHTHGRKDIHTHIRTEAYTQIQTWKLGFNALFI